MKWLIKLMLKLPARKLADIMIRIAEEIAKRTDNKADDEAVKIVKDLVEEFFK